MINTVLFDLGGTLLSAKNSPERRTDFAHRLKERLGFYGLDIPTPDEEFGVELNDCAEEYKRWSDTYLKELPLATIWSKYFLKNYHFTEEQLAPYAEELSFLYDYCRVANIRRPDAAATVKKLHEQGYKLGMVTNVLSTTYLPQLLKEYGIYDLMDILVMSSEVNIRKPDPAIFDYTLERLGVTRDQACYVGDTLSRDVLGARNAHLGLVIRLVNPTASIRDAKYKDDPNPPKPDVCITELSEIPGVIEAWNRK